MRDKSFSYDIRIRNVALKATRLVGMVLKAFSTRNIDFMVKIFAAYIRPVLEYASVVWSPFSVALNDLFANVQRRFTKRPVNLIVPDTNVDNHGYLVPAQGNHNL